MSKDKANVVPPTEEELNKARRLFARGQELAEKKSFDYAIELYLNGLDYWPDAVEEGHMPCRAAALFRGKKKVSLGDQMKMKTLGRDAKKAMLTAESMLAKEPHNPSYMESVFKNAVKGGFIHTAMWIGNILFDAVAREEKPNPGRLTVLREAYEELGDKYEEDNPALAIEALDRAVAALGRLHQLKPDDMRISTDMRDVAGKLTILKGKYGSAETFRDSVRDSDAQKDLHDKDRGAQSDERMDHLIDQARQKYEANPTEEAAVTEYVDLLCRREREKEETKAIGILIKAYQATNEYRFKMRADDIRIKQLRRASRQAKAEGDREKYRECELERLKFELQSYRGRAKQYPSELKYRYEYGMRLFEARRFDDAIPVLQEARSDPKTRHNCALYIGRSFFEKGYAGQAADTFRDAIANYDMPEDKLGKELHYWLGRSYEAEGQVEEALKIYGQLIQWDYNYRNGDVRERIDALRGK